MRPRRPWNTGRTSPRSSRTTACRPFFTAELLSKCSEAVPDHPFAGHLRALTSRAPKRRPCSDAECPAEAAGAVLPEGDDHVPGAFSPGLPNKQAAIHVLSPACQASQRGAANSANSRRSGRSRRASSVYSSWSRHVGDMLAASWLTQARTASVSPFHLP